MPERTSDGIGAFGWILVVVSFVLGGLLLVSAFGAAGEIDDGSFFLILFALIAIFFGLGITGIVVNKKKRERAAGIRGIPIATTKKEKFEQGETERLFRLAENGDEESMYEVAIYLEGIGQTDKASQWFQEAAKAGNPRAMPRHANYEFQKGKSAQALKWYEKAAKKGDAEGMFGLAVLLHEQGKVTDAKEWYIAAAKANHPAATANLGLLLYAEGDVQGAKDLYMSAIGTGGEGSQDAMCNLGQLLYDAGDKVGAMVWYRRAAEAGQQTAMLNLSQMLAESGNLEEAAEWRALSGE